MKRLKLTLLLAAFALAASFAYAQNTDSTIAAKSNPNVYVGDKILAGKQFKEAILEAPFLTATSKDGTEWNIVSYRVTFVRQISGNGVEDPPISVRGAGFSEEVIAKIQSAKSGTIIEFFEIRIQSIAGVREINKPIVIRIL